MASALPEFAAATPELVLETVIPSGQPAVLRGLVRDWPSVAAARRGDPALRAYLVALATDQPVSCVIAPPEAAEPLKPAEPMKNMEPPK